MAVIDDLPREAAIDVLDSHLGVGCYDERDDEAVRAAVMAAYQEGRIDGASKHRHYLLDTPRFGVQEFNR